MRSSSLPSHTSVLVERANVRLDLAGRALDPNGMEGGPDADTAFGLLRAAARFALIALLQLDDEATTATMSAELATTDKVSKADKETLNTLLESPERGSLDPRAAERAVARVVHRLNGGRRAERKVRLFVYGLLAMAAATAVLVVSFRRIFPPASDAYTWRSSSAYSGYADHGTLGSPQSGLIFHTAQEASPWVEIDAGRTVRISSIEIANRSDCCFERAVPLRIEVADADRRFTEVGKRTAVFDNWTLHIAPRLARYIRVSVGVPSILHLREITIR